jgi:threonine/homoserine/homoserine lactone efflux protein
MIFLPSPEVFAAFTLASLVLIFTPGPDMTFSLGQTLTAGRARGFAAMLGAATGCLFHTMLAALGLSALLAASATAFTIVKVIGAGYLVWLAIDALRHGSSLTLKPNGGETRPLVRVYLMGVGINVLNPKVVMFFVTFLPQFVSASDPAAGMKLLTLGLYFVVLSIPTPAVSSCSSPTASLRRCSARSASCERSTGCSPASWARSR